MKTERVNFINVDVNQYIWIIENTCEKRMILIHAFISRFHLIHCVWIFSLQPLNLSNAVCDHVKKKGSTLTLIQICLIFISKSQGWPHRGMSTMKFCRGPRGSTDLCQFHYLCQIFDWCIQGVCTCQPLPAPSILNYQVIYCVCVSPCAQVSRDVLLLWEDFFSGKLWLLGRLFHHYGYVYGLLFSSMSTIRQIMFMGPLLTCLAARSNQKPT